MYGAFAGEAVAQVFSHFLREEIGAVEIFEDGGGEEVACRFAEADQAVDQCAKRGSVEGDIRRAAQVQLAQEVVATDTQAEDVRAPAVAVEGIQQA